MQEEDGSRSGSEDSETSNGNLKTTEEDHETCDDSSNKTQQTDDGATEHDEDDLIIQAIMGIQKKPTGMRIQQHEYNKLSDTAAVEVLMYVIMNKMGTPSPHKGTMLKMMRWKSTKR